VAAGFQTAILVFLKLPWSNSNDKAGLVTGRHSQPVFTSSYIA
jgi:hypothetical protein